MINAYLSLFASEKILSNEETVSLYSLFKSGVESAREQLVRSNMRLVLKIANDYKRYRMDFEDIVSNGTIGLLKAIEMFDPEKGAFPQYASAWINKYISFNPRARIGARLVPDVPSDTMKASFNPRARIGARLVEFENGLLYVLFQSTRPHRGATWSSLPD